MNLYYLWNWTNSILFYSSYMDTEITLVYSENERMKVYEYTYIPKMCV